MCRIIKCCCSHYASKIKEAVITYINKEYSKLIEHYVGPKTRPKNLFWPLQFTRHARMFKTLVLGSFRQSVLPGRTTAALDKSNTGRPCSPFLNNSHNLFYMICFLEDDINIIWHIFIFNYFFLINY